jgi:hypothetical protein
MCSDWVIFEKYPQKPPCRFDYDIVEMFIIWYYTNFGFLMPIEKNKMPAITVFNM